MAQQTQADDDALPFTIESPTRGIGGLKQIVALSRYEGHEDARNVRDGRCYRCGYDRGVESTHTEVRGRYVECRNCGTPILKE